MELSLNLLKYLSLKKRGFNPKAYRERVRNLRVELDGLIQQRRMLLATSNTLSSAELKVADAETKILDDIRDLSLLEYSRFHSATKRFWAYQNTAFFS